MPSPRAKNRTGRIFASSRRGLARISGTCVRSQTHARARTSQTQQQNHARTTSARVESSIRLYYAPPPCSSARVITQLYVLPNSCAFFRANPGIEIYDISIDEVAGLQIQIHISERAQQIKLGRRSFCEIDRVHAAERNPALEA